MNRRHFLRVLGTGNIVLAVVIGVTLVLLFLVPSNGLQERSVREFWNFGHIPCFAVISLLISLRWKSSSRGGSLLRSALLVLGITSASLLIELIQSHLGRTFDYGDIEKNLIGCLVGISIRDWFMERGTAPRPTVLHLGLALLVLIEAAPLAGALADEFHASRRFPVLADFETSAELTRWEGSERITLDCDHAQHGKCSGRIRFTTELYSGVGLRYLPRDWRGYKELRFGILNPSDTPATLTCRIHDRRHESTGLQYDDRFNRTVVAQHGWNEFVFPLEQVAQAPMNRTMDMAHIAEFQVFMTKLAQERELCMDFVRLVR